MSRNSSVYDDLASAIKACSTVFIGREASDSGHELHLISASGMPIRLPHDAKKERFDKFWALPTNVLTNKSLILSFPDALPWIIKSSAHAVFSHTASITAVFKNITTRLEQRRYPEADCFVYEVSIYIRLLVMSAHLSQIQIWNVGEATISDFKGAIAPFLADNEHSENAKQRLSSQYCSPPLQFNGSAMYLVPYSERIIVFKDMPTQIWPYDHMSFLCGGPTYRRALPAESNAHISSIVSYKLDMARALSFLTITNLDLEDKDSIMLLDDEDRDALWVHKDFWSKRVQVGVSKWENPRPEFEETVLRSQNDLFGPAKDRKFGVNYQIAGVHRPALATSLPLLIAFEEHEDLDPFDMANRQGFSNSTINEETFMNKPSCSSPRVSKRKQRTEDSEIHFGPCGPKIMRMESKSKPTIGIEDSEFSMKGKHPATPPQTPSTFSFHMYPDSESEFEWEDIQFDVPEITEEEPLIKVESAKGY